MGHVPSIDSNIKMFQWIEKEQNIDTLNWIPVYLAGPLLNNSSAVPEFEKVSEKRMCQVRASNVNSCRSWDCRLPGLWHQWVSYGVINFLKKTTVSIIIINISTVCSLRGWMCHKKWHKIIAVSTSLSFLYLPSGNTSKLNLNFINRGQWYNFHNGFAIQTSSSNTFMLLQTTFTALHCINNFTEEFCETSSNINAGMCYF
jgi:hypothetical protein